MHLEGANICRVHVTNADLRGAQLIGANLRDAELIRAALVSADLSRADLRWAHLTWAEVTWADLSLADLRGTELIGANFRGANLHGAALSGARLSSTTFAGIDLSAVKGLDGVIHEGPSYIDIHTIQRSQGKIPEVFLRGAGVADIFIDYVASLAEQPIQFYSCFISYSSKDQAFAERLYADLQDKGVRCWFATEDMRIGAKIRPTLDESIWLQDKLLLILSENSIASGWVEQEVETALAREREEGRTVLFPVRLDDAIMKIKAGWPALIWNTRHIGDFTRWKDYGAYQKAFDRLLRDLKAEE